MKIVNISLGPKTIDLYSRQQMRKIDKETGNAVKLLIRPYEGSTPFGLSQSKPLDELAFRQAQGERLQTFKGRINNPFVLSQLKHE
jgi:hypothetical protein